MQKVTKTRTFKATQSPKFFKTKIVLIEDDVPGVSFKNRDPRTFHNEQLKRWLKCRGASVGGSRTELQGL